MKEGRNERGKKGRILKEGRVEERKEKRQEGRKDAEGKKGRKEGN